MSQNKVCNISGCNGIVYPLARGSNCLQHTLCPNQAISSFNRLTNFLCHCLSVSRIDPKDIHMGFTGATEACTQQPYGFREKNTIFLRRATNYHEAGILLSEPQKPLHQIRPVRPRPLRFLQLNHRIHRTPRRKGK